MQIYSINKSPNPKKSKFNLKKFKLSWNWKKILLWSFRVIVLGVLASAAMFAYLWITLPTPEKLMSRDIPESTKILDREGGLLYEIHGEYKRTTVDLKDINKFAQNATVAIEDKDFYKHKGFSLWAIFRTFVTDIIYRKTAGGSTITQQFIKNAALSRDKTAIRKLKELFLAVQLETKYSKDQILNFYLNEIPYGRNAYGIESASRAYFNKSAHDLTLAESAYLAAIPQAPSFYNPTGPNRANLDSRQKKVLANMKEQKFITEDQEKAALEEKVEFQQAKTSLLAPHFVLYVQDYLAGKYGEKTLEEGGMKIQTTLDPILQQIAERVVKENVEKNATKYDAANSSLVAIDPKTGQILAMVGSKDYFAKSSPEGCTPGKDCTFEPNVNVALSERQPGSSFKPYVYLTAFTKEGGYSPSSPIFDVITSFGNNNGKPYQPSNYNGQQYGPTTMRKALAGSLNIPAVKTLALVGVDNAIDTARKLGITSPLKDCGLSLVLGGCEVRLLDHTASMATIANMGKKNEKTAILKIEDKQGKVLEEYKQNQQEVIDPQAVYQLISIMTDNDARSYIFGGNSPLNYGERPVGCKTGTTNNWHDGWTMCFTPSLAVGVWSGNNNGKLLKKGADGVYVAAPIVNGFIKEALKDKPIEKFSVPEGIQNVIVDVASGKLPTSFSGNTRAEVFANYNTPRTYDDVHVAIKFDKTTGFPATELTPPDNVELKLYNVYHSEEPNNPAWENPVKRWAEAKGYEYPPEGSIKSGDTGGSTSKPANFSIDIQSPQEGATILQLPFDLSVFAPIGADVARMDLLIDGTFFSSINFPPYKFSVTKQLPDGEHTFVVKAVDSSGGVSQTSLRAVYSLGQELYIKSPQNNDTVNLPFVLSAESQKDLGDVSFFYTDKKGELKLIGQATKGEYNGKILYELTLDSIGQTGSLKIFAKSSSGSTSNKISLTIQ